MVPALTSISPTAGHTGGKSFVELNGTGFRLPDQLDPVNGIVPEAAPSMRVTFGASVARSVVVVSSTLAYAVTPIANPTAAPVGVTVQNLDADGVAIAGEAFTLDAAWRFVRPNITDGDSDLVRLIRAFVDELTRQVIANVTWPQSTDYDEDTADTLSIAEVPKLPGLIVAATELIDNEFYAVRDPQESDDPDDPNGFVVREPPVTVDVLFTVVGVTDNAKELLNLSATVKRFFKKNPYLTMARDPDDASKGEVSYEMDGKDAPDVKLSVDANQNNLRSFAITARIRGFDIEAMHEIREADGTPARGAGGADESTIGIGKTLEDDPVLSIEPLGQGGLS